MTVQEFSIEFDILFNNINSNFNQGFNEYEKSIFLTNAQDEIIANHFIMHNNKQEGLNNSPYRDSEFSNLFKTIGLNNGIVEDINIPNKLNKRIRRFLTEEKFRFIINEICNISRRDQDGDILETLETNVVPVHYSEYSRLISGPYCEPNKYESWRLLGDQVEENITTFDLIIRYGFEIDNYIIRCIKEPLPIITVDFSTDPEFENLTIRGRNTITECELHPLIHLPILKRAVKLAEMAYLKNSVDEQLNPANY